METMKQDKSPTATTFFPARTEHAFFSSWSALGRGRLSMAWPTLPVLVPHRWRWKFRSRLRSRQSPASSLTALQTSFSPADTIRSLRNHRWSLYDGQYLLLAVLAVFSLCVIETPGPMVETVIAILLLSSLVIPITRQFFLPFLPIASWLVLFYAAR